MKTNELRRLAQPIADDPMGISKPINDPDAVRLAKAALLMADVVDAARAFIGHGHPRDIGCCQTDHYTDRFCDCGYSSIETAIAAFDAAKLEG